MPTRRCVPAARCPQAHCPQCITRASQGGVCDRVLVCAGSSIHLSLFPQRPCLRPPRPHTNERPHVNPIQTSFIEIEYMYICEWTAAARILTSCQLVVVSSVVSCQFCCQLSVVSCQFCCQLGSVDRTAEASRTRLRCRSLSHCARSRQRDIPTHTGPPWRWRPARG